MTAVKFISFNRKAFLWLSLAAAFFMPVSWLLFNYLAVVIALLWLGHVVFLKQFAGFRHKRIIFLIGGLILLYFLLNAVGLLYSDNLSRGYKILGVKTYLLLLPLLYWSMCWGRNERILVLKFFIFGTLLSSMIVFVVALFGEGTLSEEIQNTCIVPFHHTYYALFLNLSQIILFYFLEKKIKFFNNHVWDRIVYFSGIAFLLLFTYLAESRAGVIASFIILLIFTVRLIRSRKRNMLLLIFLFVACIGLISTLIYKSERLSTLQVAFHEVFNQDSKASFESARLIIWNNAFDLLQDHYVTGVGTGDVLNELKSSYRANEEWHSYRKSFNAHNEFLETFLRIGVLGFIIFLAIFVVIICYAIKNRDLILINFVWLMFFFFNFETMLNRIQGVIFFAFFIAVLVATSELPLQANQRVGSPAGKP